MMLKEKEFQIRLTRELVNQPQIKIWGQPKKGETR